MVMCWPCIEVVLTCSVLGEAKVARVKNVMGMGKSVSRNLKDTWIWSHWQDGLIKEPVCWSIE
jgi:hypothetical protein